VFLVVARSVRSPAEGRVTLADLGAWLLKGNADRVDLAERFRRDPRVESWCVQPGYRARLMAAGQLVVFWASGSRGRLPYGVWGVGRVTGPAELRLDDGRWRASLDLTIADPTEWVPRQQLRADPRLADAEVFRQPMAANPSYLTKAQLAALQDHLGIGVDMQDVASSGCQIRPQPASHEPLTESPSTVATTTAAAADQAWGWQAVG
jgi:hypothetical protein